MRGRSCGLALAALAAALVVAARGDTTPADIVGAYEKIDASEYVYDAHCPSTLRTATFDFDQFADEDFPGFEYFNIKIPHRNMRINAADCTSTGSLWAVESSHPSVTDKRAMLDDWASAHGSNYTSYLASDDFLDHAEEIDFIFGYDYVERECGKGKMRAGSLFLWIEPQFSVNPHPLFEMDKGEKYLLVTHERWDKERACVYKAGEVGGNSDVDNGPVSDPAREENFTFGGVAPKNTSEATPTPEPEDEPEPAADAVSTDNDDPATPADDGVFGAADKSAPAESDDAKCFPAHATVTRADGAVVRMDALAHGDAIVTGPGGQTSDVFMFTHRDAAVSASFVVASTASGASLTLTPGHFVYVNGDLTAAEKIAVGDTLTVTSGAQSVVTRVAREEHRGLYNPQTVSGDIVVDGVLASTYTTAVDPAFAHSLLLAPVRALYRANLGRVLVGLFDKGAAALERWLPSGASVVA